MTRVDCLQLSEGIYFLHPETKTVPEKLLRVFSVSLQRPIGEGLQEGEGGGRQPQPSLNDDHFEDPETNRFDRHNEDQRRRRRRRRRRCDARRRLRRCLKWTGNIWPG